MICAFFEACIMNISMTSDDGENPKQIVNVVFLRKTFLVCYIIFQMFKTFIRN